MLMNRDGEQRIYVQMAPDDQSAAALGRIGPTLPNQLLGRLVPQRELHMSLIHFGKTADVLATIRQVVQIADGEYKAHVAAYITATQELLSDTDYHLTSRGYDRFGVHNTVLAARYEAPAELKEVHHKAYTELIRFLGACGIENAQRFAETDRNFMHARTFTPHITLYKGYNGPLPYGPPPPDVTARFMKLVY